MKYREELIKYVTKIVGNSPEIEDIVQDSIMASLEKRDNLLNEQNHKNWLFRIARNKAIDHLKSNRKSSNKISNIEISEERIENNNSIFTLAENNKDLYYLIKDLYLTQKKSANDVRYFLISIFPEVEIVSEEYVEILLMSEFYQFSQQEIANRLKIPLPTAKSRIQRAKLKTKEVFLKRCNFEFDQRGSILNFKCK